MVLSTFAHPATHEILDVTIGQGEDAETIGVTETHPFWSVQDQAFVPVGHLVAGSQVLTADEQTKTITSILPRPGPAQQVYNLEVNGEHVYYVGQQQLLVHNDCFEIQRRLSKLTKQARDELLSDPNKLRQYLTKSQFKKLTESPHLMTPFFGHALEKRVEDLRKLDSLLKDLKWTGVSNKPYDWLAPNGTRYDVTGGSWASLMKHQNRPQIDVVLTYESIPRNFGFEFIRFFGF